jgi:class 3 adenylate cyclase/tetratricopeptide (TPR) repeat protein
VALIACSRCGTENEADRRFCVECGNRLGGPCPVCGTVNPAEAKFCGNCGTALAGGAGSGSGTLDQVVRVGASGVAERRLVSVLFVDLVGFTTASERRDAEDTRELLTTYYDTAREIVARHGGTIEKFIGDAVMAVWGAPSAHEDDAERAIRAALEIVTSVPRLTSESDALQARAGVLTGEAAVTVGLVGQGMIAGDLVNTASRLQSIATPGTVLVGDATYRAASRAIAFEDAGQRELKGKELPVQVWRALSVVAKRGGEGRAVTLEPPFVGRDDELSQLKDLFHATARDGKSRLVTLSGVAGIGKSRLLWELEKYLDGVIGVVYWHGGRSPSYGEGISYWALAEMVRGRAGIAESDDPATARERIGQMLAEFVPAEEDRRWIEPRLTGLLGIDELPTESRDELFAAWRTLFERIASKGPTVLAFSDIQWADQGLLEFVEQLLSWARESPIFVLAEARPELYERRPTWGHGVRSATLIHLDPLGADDMRRLLTGLVPQLPQDALRRIVERAEGVPLYAVETLRMLIDRGVIRATDGGYVLSGELPELAVPETLHALIAARLDSLTPEQRNLLADGSVLGVSFTVPSLMAVSGLHEAEVSKLLDALVGRELLTLDADPRSPERGQYRFLQGVVREVAYQSMAKRSRQAKHLAAARYFESLGEGELAGVLATHYLAAYRAAPAGPEAEALAAQARIALRGAADRATALHDLLGGLAYIEQALPITPDPVDQAALHERAVPLAGEAAQFPRALEHARAAATIYADRGDRLGVVRAKAREAFVQLGEHQDQTAIALLRDALADTTDLGPSADIAHAQAELGRALMLAGEVESIEWCDRVLEQSAVAAPEIVLEAVITKGTALQNIGRDLEGEIILRGAALVADSMGALFSAIRARNNLRVQLQSRDLRASLELTRELLEIARKFGQRTWVLHGAAALVDISFRLGDWDSYVDEAKAEHVDASGYYRSWFAAEEAMRETYRGDPAAAEATLRRLLTSETSVSSEQAITWHMAAMAEAQLAQGRADDAFTTAAQSWSHSAEADRAYVAGLFAAGAAADSTKVETVRAAWRAAGTGQLPLPVALERIADALTGAIDGRWSDAHAAYLAAAARLEEVGEYVNLARLQLALAHLGGEHLPEVVAKLPEAEAFFAERGATSWVATYRAAARRPKVQPVAAAEASTPDGAAEPRETVRGSSGSVRSGG